jgi:hypothetical protein
MTQSKGRRRGEVFPLRMTLEEREAITERMRVGDGPRALGPFMVWASKRLPVIPARACPDKPSVVLPEFGSRAPEVLPMPGSGMLEGPPIEERTILDLCAGSGSWSEPYAAAGYNVVRVTLPETDVRTFAPPRDVWGVLCAPPCDQFSVARNAHDKTNPRDILRGLEVVSACMRIVLTARPKFWALENPVGLLGQWLGTPRDVFQPCDFGDAWTKRTALWGDFELPERGPFVEPIGGGPLCSICDPTKRSTTWCNNSAHRAITPAGFARAFFRANP